MCIQISTLIYLISPCALEGLEKHRLNTLPLATAQRFRGSPLARIGGISGDRLPTIWH